MCAPSPPPPPDFGAAARAQGAANLQSTIASNILNRPNEITPLGSRVWSQSGSTTIPGAEGNPAVDVPTYTSQVNLTPLGQQRFDQEQRIISQLGGMAEGGLGRVQGSISSPLSVGGADALQTQTEDALLARSMPRLEQAEERALSNAVVRGHNPNSAGYGEIAKNFGESRNDLIRQATLDAQRVRPQFLQEELAIRNQPLNEINALRTGAQVQLPQFQPFSTSQVQPAPLFGAAQAGHNAALQAHNAEAMANAQMIGGLFGLGGAALGAPVGASGKPWWLG